MPTLDIQALKLPVMPEVAQTLIRTLNDEDATAEQVTDIISKDPALTATLLRMANSAEFGLSHTVTSLQRAVNVLGMSQVRARALSICMSQVFIAPPGLDRMALWRYSMTCAGYAKWLAQQLGLDAQQAWLCAMMMRLGEIVLLQHAPDLLPVLQQQPCTTPQRWARQVDQVGMDEGQLTSKISERWNFPDNIVMALAAVGRPTERETYSSMGAVVHLAALLTDMAAAGADASAQLPNEVMQSLGLEEDDLLSNIPTAQSLNDVSMLQA
jgi:HD-like signal output (HDOD) protein